jgi:hypothetical protein
MSYARMQGPTPARHPCGTVGGYSHAPKPCTSGTHLLALGMRSVQKLLHVLYLLSSIQAHLWHRACPHDIH